MVCVPDLSGQGRQSRRTAAAGLGETSAYDSSQSDMSQSGADDDFSRRAEPARNSAPENARACATCDDDACARDRGQAHVQRGQTRTVFRECVGIMTGTGAIEVQMPGAAPGHDPVRSSGVVTLPSASAVGASAPLPAPWRRIRQAYNTATYSDDKSASED